jgi:hypothetical protein
MTLVMTNYNILMTLIQLITGINSETNPNICFIDITIKT